MCGILGFIGSPWRDHAVDALATLRSRGPDAREIMDLGEAVLGHTRLAVIDWHGGKQPMQSPDGRYTLVYNGEIYNFHSIRKELKNRGIRFATNSDTEVLLQGLIAWGENALPMLDGMFAFALWDAKKRIMLAARDRVGIKPLMYSTAGGGVMIASTLAPFLATPNFPKNISPEGIRDYFTFDTPMAPHTILKNVHQLPPACILKFCAPDNAIKIKHWWRIPPATSAVDADFATATATVKSNIHESVRRQMIADVPLGAFLSGGIDSSLIVRYMAEHTTGKVKTFSVKFAREYYDESKYAAEVSDYFNTDHNIIDASSLSGTDFVIAIEALDQPLADMAYPMTYWLSYFTRRQVTVAFSGDGGDETFGGYPKYLDTESSHQPQWAKTLLRGLIETGIAPKLFLENGLCGKEHIFYRKDIGQWATNRNASRYLHPELAAQVQPDTNLQSWVALIEEFGGVIDSDTLMRADLWTYLSENCLVKTDRASMAHGLEVRVPFLGLPLFPESIKLPPQFHFGNGLKSLLTAVAREELPRSVWDREKHGFDAPMDDFFIDTWKDTIGELISAAPHIAPFLNIGIINQLWTELLSRKWRSEIYKLVVLLIWQRKHKLIF